MGEQDLLVVTFNQVMRDDETTLTFTPQLSGTLEWMDQQTLLFILDRYF
jgi:hypothetical protein